MQVVRGIILGLVAAALVAGGAVSMAWLISTKPAPPMRTTLGRVLQVEVAPVRMRIEATPIVASGHVRPKNQVNIIPQVSGRLIFTHEDLAQGKVISKGELLFSVDPAVYEARLHQAEAEVRALAAALERHDQEVINLREAVTNAEQMLAIDDRDYLVSKRLYDKDNVGTQRALDQILHNYLRQKGIVVEFRSRLAISPHLKLETQARLDAAKSRLEQARHDLSNTKIRCPFDARVETVSAYVSQVVTAFFSIATLTDIQAFEISVGVDPTELRWLAEAIHPQALLGAGPQRDGGPTVIVRWSLQDQEFTWRGRVTRFERIDEQTRTARMVVEVRREDMVATVDRGNLQLSPALALGMYCRTELPAQPLLDAVLVPRHTIHDNQWVYVFEPDGDDSSGAPSVALAKGGIAGNDTEASQLALHSQLGSSTFDEEPGSTGRLGRRRITRLRSVGDYVLVDYRGRQGTGVCELRPGELLVVSPLVNPVVGAKVRLGVERSQPEVLGLGRPPKNHPQTTLDPFPGRDAKSHGMTVADSTMQRRRS